jgi:hypothetical protein
MADVGGYNMRQMPNFTPEQMDLFKSMFSNVGPGSYLSRLAGGDQALFEQMEQPAQRQFAQQQGQIASRFSGMGQGAQKGSGFQNTMNQASQDFSSQLQQNRMGLQKDALNDLMNMSNSLLNQRPYENFLQPKKKSFLETLFTQGLPMLGQAYGNYQNQQKGFGNNSFGNNSFGNNSFGGNSAGGNNMADIMKLLPLLAML